MLTMTVGHLAEAFELEPRGSVDLKGNGSTRVSLLVARHFPSS